MIDKKEILSDSSQYDCVVLLNKLFLDLKSFYSGSFYSKLISSVPKNRSLYLFGPAGTGKTLLMDLFHRHIAALEIPSIRLHYHRFMHLVHDKLSFYAHRKDPISYVAKWFDNEYKVLCLDELFVEDIADAMILGHLFCYLEKSSLSIVLTSNVLPENLYKNGLQRENFLPAIKMIQKCFIVKNVFNSMDYRTQKTNAMSRFFVSDPLFAKKMKALYFRWSGFELDLNVRKMLCLQGRYIDIIEDDNSILVIDFSVICGNGRSQNDYIEISSSFKAVFLLNVPIIKNDDFMRRMIAFIDELYDNHILLVMNLDTDIKSLYLGERLSFQFQRCYSRLLEMQSLDYFDSSSFFKE